jgi:hypothetical protein
MRVQEEVVERYREDGQARSRFSSGQCPAASLPRRSSIPTLPVRCRCTGDTAGSVQGESWKTIMTPATTGRWNATAAKVLLQRAS